MGFWPVVDARATIEPMIVTSNMIVTRFPMQEMFFSPTETVLFSEMVLSGTNLTVKQSIDSIARAGMAAKGMNVMGGGLVE